MDIDKKEKHREATRKWLSSLSHEQNEARKRQKRDYYHSEKGQNWLNIKNKKFPFGR